MSETTRKQTLVISDLTSFASWRRQLRAVIGGPTSVEFQLLNFSEEDNRRLSATATRLHRTCGCAISGVFMSGAIVILAESFFISGNTFSDIGIRQILTFLGIVVLAALVGKICGLVWARWRLIHLAAWMHDRLSFSQQESASTFTPEKEYGARL